MKSKILQLQVQKQVLAPLMQQSIAVLLLPITDLNLTIEQELQDNPLLEINDDDPSHQKDEAINRHIEQFSQMQRELRHLRTEDDEALEERPLTREVPLEDYLMQQLRLEVSDELQIKIGEFIIGNIDEDGYLKISCEEIATLLGIEDIKLVEHVLLIVQGFEPVGIAARSLKECILIQMRQRDSNGEFVTRLVNECLEDLGRKRYSEIAKKLEASVEEVRRVAHFISCVDPKPARNHRPINSNIYIKPDVFITYDLEHGYQVTTNEEGIPQLRINTTYKNMLNRPNLKEEERIFIRARLEGALHFIKSIEQRGQTIREIARYILEYQKDFFGGNHLSIKPMTLKNVAQAINRNESTISRAINNKYIDTPQGLFSMKFFFSQAVSTTNEQTSSQSIKEEIKELVDAENMSSPLSDRDIQVYFERKGVRLARRTVTKYREALRIPPSYLRKKHKLN